MGQVRLHTGCINCMAERHLNHYDSDTPEAEKLAYMQGVLGILSEAETFESAPVVTERIYELQRKMFGETLDFSEIKHTYNQMMKQEEESPGNRGSRRSFKKSHSVCYDGELY